MEERVKYCFRIRKQSDDVPNIGRVGRSESQQRHVTAAMPQVILREADVCL